MSSNLSYLKTIENVIQSLIFQVLVIRISVQCVIFALSPNMLALLRANGKYNVKLCHLTGGCQITSI